MPRLELPEAFAGWLPHHRWKVAYGGRGGGKSWTIVDLLIAMGLDRPLRILCAREIQGSVKESVKRLIEDRIHDLGVADKFTILNSSITAINGTEFIFEGLRYNVNRIKSMEGIDIAWVEEADVVSDASWRTLIPTIRKEGSEIWVSFNPRLSTDAAYKRFVLNKPSSSFVVNVNWRDNPWFTDTLRMEMNDLRAMDEDEYLHVYEGQLREYAEGAIYAQQLKKVTADGRYCSLPVTKREVHTFWDLGKDDALTIWFMQQNGPWHDFLHYTEDSGKEIGHYGELVKEIATERGFNLGRHYMPHDVDQDHLGMRASRREQFIDAGIKPIKVVPRVRNLQEGIMATKRMFASCRFDSEYASDGWTCLANYRRSFNEVNGKFSDTPVHDWASHGADGFRQFGQGYRPDKAEKEGADEMSQRRRDSIRRNKRAERNGMRARV